MERWKSTEYRDTEVSDLGRIRENGIIKEPFIGLDGYPSVNCGSRKERVMNLVAKAWVENSQNKPCVHPIDFNPLNCRADNLEWATMREIALLNIKNGIYGNKYHKDYQILGVLDNDPSAYRIFSSQAQAAKEIGCHNSEINKVLRGKRNTCHGWRFYYIEDFPKDADECESYVDLETLGYIQWLLDNGTCIV